PRSASSWMRCLMQWRGRLTQPFLFLVLIAAGCDDSPSTLPADQPDPSVPLAVAFDPARAGSIRGQVTWEGPIPHPPLLETWSLIMADDGSRERWCAPNPNAPCVDAASRGVGNAVVFLRGVDSRRAKPWNHPPVLIEQRGRELHVRQGDVDGRDGFVRRGD